MSFADQHGHPTGACFRSWPAFHTWSYAAQHEIGCLRTVDDAADMLSRGASTGAGPGSACPLLLRACAHGGPPVKHLGALYGFCSAAARQRFTAAPSAVAEAAASATLRAPHLGQLLGLPVLAQVPHPDAIALLITCHQTFQLVALHIHKYAACSCPREVCQPCRRPTLGWQSPCQPSRRHTLNHLCPAD